MKSFNDLNLNITGDSNRVGSFTNVLGLIVAKTTGTTASLVPSQIAPNTLVTITVPEHSASAWEVGGTIRCHVDFNANDYYEYLNNAAQIETATAVGTILTSGNATVTLTSAAVLGGVQTLSVAVEEDDTPEMWAEKVFDALNTNANITVKFEIRRALDKIILIRKPVSGGRYPRYDLNDASLNLSFANGTCTGIIENPTSDNTASGAQHEDSIFGTIQSKTSTQVVMQVVGATPTSIALTNWIVSYRSPNFSSRLNSMIDDFKTDLDQLQNISL